MSHLCPPPSPQHPRLSSCSCQSAEWEKRHWRPSRIFYSSQSFISLPLQTFVAPRTALKQFFFFFALQWEVFCRGTRQFWFLMDIQWFFQRKLSPDVNNKRSVQFFICWSLFFIIFPSNFSTLSSRWCFFKKFNDKWKAGARGGATKRWWK